MKHIKATKFKYFDHIKRHNAVMKTVLEFEGMTEKSKKTVAIWANRQQHKRKHATWLNPLENQNQKRETCYSQHSPEETVHDDDIL